MTWGTRKVQVQAGTYAVSAVEITEHFSLDGRFTIRRTGGMRYCSQTGFHGQKYNHWVWTGYLLHDAINNRSIRHSTVAMCKRRASRLAQRGAVVNPDTQHVEVN